MLCEYDGGDLDVAGGTLGTEGDIMGVGKVKGRSVVIAGGGEDKWRGPLVSSLRFICPGGDIHKWEDT